MAAELQVAAMIIIFLVGSIFIPLIVWFHRRLKALEDVDEQRRGLSSFFGDGDSPLNVGLAKELRVVGKEQEDMQQQLNEIYEKMDEIERRLNEMEND